jgi:hypothetical protein
MKKGVNKINKRGASGHLEMIFSFLFFIGFVLFLILTINPYNTSTRLNPINRELANSIERMVETNLTSFFLKASITSGRPCIKIKLQKSANLLDIQFENVSVFNPFDENKIDGFIDIGADDSRDLKIRSGYGNYKIFISPEFNRVFNGFNGPCDEPTDYIIGNVLERNVSSNRSLTQIRNRYYNNYLGLKNELGVPENFDFSIISPELPHLNMTRNLPESGEIFGKTYIHEVLHQNGTIVNARLIISVW